MAHCIKHGSYDPWTACYDGEKIICRKCWEETNLSKRHDHGPLQSGSHYYAGMERDDGWTQRLELSKRAGKNAFDQACDAILYKRLEESRQKYEAQVEDLRRKAGLPSLSQTVVPPSHPLLTAKLQRAIMEVEHVLQAGEVKYPNEKWRTQPSKEHIAHAMTHLLQIIAYDCTEDHLAHAACRLLMALEKRHDS